MGNTLEAPITTKDTERFQRSGGFREHHRDDRDDSERESCQLKDPDAEKAVHRVIPGGEFDDGIVAAACSMQGWRRTMEDRVSARMDIEGRPLGVRHIFCLFDGHGGDSVADYCSRHLTDDILGRLRARHACQPSSRAGERFDEGINVESDGDNSPSVVAGCVQEACRDVDLQVKGKFFTSAGQYVAPRADDPLDLTPPQVISAGDGKTSPTPGDAPSNEEKDTTETPRPIDDGGHKFSTCGTTSLIVLITDDLIICCNTGDSRAVLASEGASKPLSIDHKPENRLERQRIEAAGGIVKHNRVNGRLAVSRCIGDHPFKSDPTLPRDKQMVVCDPEVAVVARSFADEFVVMACDGIWDVMGNDEACLFLRKCIQEGDKNLGHMLEQIEDACLAKQSMDNMSVLVIAFRAAWEEGLHLHRSARYVLHWGCNEVLRWLSTNNFGQYEEEFERNEINGVGLLSLTEGDLHHKLRLKKVGLRKKLWQKLSPLRLGYLAWNKKELAAWLGHVGLKDLQTIFVRAGIDGRALSAMSKADVMSFARKAAIDRPMRHRLCSAIGELREGGAGSEWVALHGVDRYTGPEGDDATADVWLPSPATFSSRCNSREASFTSSSSSSSSDTAEYQEGGIRRVSRGGARRKTESDGLDRDVQAPVVVGQGYGLRKGSRSSALSGARKLSRVLMHKFESPDCPPGAPGHHVLQRPGGKGRKNRAAGDEEAGQEPQLEEGHGLNMREAGKDKAGCSLS